MRNVEILNCEPEGSERSVIAIERGETEDGHPTMIVHVIEPGRSAKIGVRSGVELSLSDSMPKLVAVAEADEDHAVRDETPVTEDGEGIPTFDELDNAPVEEGEPTTDEVPATEPELDPIDGQSDIVAGEPHTGSIVQ